MTVIQSEFFQQLDRVNARHEAGHMTIYKLFGGTWGAVWILDPDKTSGGWAGNTNLGTGIFDLDLKKRLLVNLAGVGAELLDSRMPWPWAHHPPRGGEEHPLQPGSWTELLRTTGSGDWKAAKRHLDEIGGNRRAVMREAKTEVTRLLSENWEWVTAVTDLLLKERYLYGKEVEACRPTPPRL